MNLNPRNLCQKWNPVIMPQHTRTGPESAQCCQLWVQWAQFQHVYRGWTWSMSISWAYCRIQFDRMENRVSFLREYIWVRSRNCGCLVTWFCYQLIAKPGNKTTTVSWPDPYIDSNYWYISFTKYYSCCIFISIYLFITPWIAFNMF